MNDTFIFMYMLYKLGCAGLDVFLLMLFATAIQVLIHYNISCTRDTFPIRITITILLMLLGLIVGIVTPHYNEMKAWIYYTVTENTADKKEAEKLIQTAFDYLDETSK